MNSRAISKGRSPRVRGSHGSSALQSVLINGSIPACAGEPTGIPPWIELKKVDPRVCGGAVALIARAFADYGRSPRVRGSPRHAMRVLALSGSIPACAGEPRQARPCPGDGGVDPRVCGGAGFIHLVRPLPQGRSPRVRGSPAPAKPDDDDPGSIPACAGEPRLDNGAARSRRVDPRVCGGAGRTDARPGAADGRSPRVRGSHGDGLIGVLGMGSIPACAGEPYPPRRPCRRSAVDPRVCGGAPPPCRG